MQSTIALLLSVNSGFAKKKFQPRGRISNKIELLSHAAKLVFCLFDLRSFPDKELHFIYISYLTHCGWTYFQMVGIVSADLSLDCRCGCKGIFAQGTLSNDQGLQGKIEIGLKDQVLKILDFQKK